MGTIAAAIGALLIAVLIGFTLLFVRVTEVESQLDSVLSSMQAADGRADELSGRLDELRASVDGLTEELSLTDSSGSGNLPPELAATLRDIADQVREVDDGVQALNDRVDEICEGVPVC